MSTWHNNVSILYVIADPLMVTRVLLSVAFLTTLIHVLCLSVAAWQGCDTEGEAAAQPVRG